MNCKQLKFEAHGVLDLGIAREDCIDRHAGSASNPIERDTDSERGVRP